MKSKMVIISTFVEKLLAYGSSRGLNPDELYRAAGLPRSEEFSPEKWVPISCSNRLWGHLMRHLDDPGTPVHFAQTLCVEDYNALGFAGMFCSELSEVLNRILVNFAGYYTNSGRWEVNRGNGEVAMLWRRDLPLDLGHRVANENSLAEILHTARQVVSEELRPNRVLLRHSRPKSTTAHEEFFRAPVFFGQTMDCIVFSNEWMEAPLLQPNQALAAFFERYLAEMVKKTDGRMRWSNKVRDTLTKNLPNGHFSATEVAKRLAVSERCLRRYLQAEGTNYREIISSMRRERAEYLLTQTDLSVGEIALTLGYSDIAAFSRAFKAQTGVSPQNMRVAVVNGSI